MLILISSAPLAKLSLISDTPSYCSKNVFNSAETKRISLMSLPLNSNDKSEPPPGPPGAPILKVLTPGISGITSRQRSYNSMSVIVRSSPLDNSTNTCPPNAP